jgi:O-antigen ligase
MYGLQTKRGILRAGSWLLAVGCLYIVGLTVSRGSIFASALAITIGFRHFLKRGFVPILLLIILIGVTYEAGIFDKITAQYEERGMEDTGRRELWPDAISRLFASSVTPLIGVGVSNVGSQVLGPGLATPPHNSFLYFALSSGVLPLAFYALFWVRILWQALFRVKNSADDVFQLPIVVFTFVVILIGDLGFMSPWGILVFCLAAGSSPSYKIGQPHFLRSRQGIRPLQRALYPRSGYVGGTHPIAQRPKIARRRKSHPW